MSAKHTPTPWTLDKPLRGADGSFVTDTKANAEFIVRAVNEYDEDKRKIEVLLKATKYAISQIERHGMFLTGPDGKAIGTRGERNDTPLFLEFSLRVFFRLDGVGLSFRMSMVIDLVGDGSWINNPCRFDNGCSIDDLSAVLRLKHAIAQAEATR